MESSVPKETASYDFGSLALAMMNSLISFCAFSSLVGAGLAHAPNKSAVAAMYSIFFISVNIYNFILFSTDPKKVYKILIPLGEKVYKKFIPLGGKVYKKYTPLWERYINY